MAIPNPNPNIADGMKCDNKTYSSNKIEELVSSAGGDDPRIPDPAVGDIGKVLGIVSDGSTGAEYGAIAASSNVVIIEFPDEFPEDIEELPEGITGEYIYNLIHSGKIVFFKVGLDSGEGTYIIPVITALNNRGDYTITAKLTYCSLIQGNIHNVQCYEIIIFNNTVSADYGYFNAPT